MPRAIFFRGWVTRETGCSEHDDGAPSPLMSRGARSICSVAPRQEICSRTLRSSVGSAEPLPRTIPLLPRRIENPLLGLQVDDLLGNLVEPRLRHGHVADSAPELTDEIGQDRTLVARDTVVALQSSREHPGCVAPVVAIGFTVSLVDTAPCRTQEKVRDVSRLHRLPFGNLRCGLVFLRAGQHTRGDRR